MVYKLSAKDKNTGTIQGNIKDDLLVAKYTFMSEGVESVREVAFKLKGNTFTEGYGEIEMKNEIATLKDIHNLTFNNQMPLTEIPCP